MRKTTFDTYKSTNQRLHNKMSQADEYQKFLKRIEKIVDRKAKVDRSPQFYMTFLNKSRERSNQQKSKQKDFLIQLQNKSLLSRIQKQKVRKPQELNTLHEIHFEQKRQRDLQKINQENSQMAQRIMNQDSYLINKGILSLDMSKLSNDKTITKQREIELKFFDSRVKNRKLPKLIRTPSLPDTSVLR